MKAFLVVGNPGLGTEEPLGGFDTLPEALECARKFPDAHAFDSIEVLSDEGGEAVSHYNSAWGK